MNQSIEIKIDEKERSLRYTFRAISEIEETLDKPFAKIDFAHMRYKELSVIVWAGLKHEDKRITPDYILDCIDAGVKTDYMLTKILEAMADQFEEPEKK